LIAGHLRRHRRFAGEIELALGTLIVGRSSDSFSAHASSKIMRGAFLVSFDLMEPSELLKLLSRKLDKLCISHLVNSSRPKVDK